MWAIVIFALIAAFSYSTEAQSVSGKFQIPSKICLPLMFPKKNVEQRDELVETFREEWFTKSADFKKISLSDKEVAWIDRLKSVPLPRPTSVRAADTGFLSTVRSKRQAATCQYITTPMRVRKEYRQLTYSQRTSFHNAVKALKTYVPDPVTGKKAYDIFVELHRGSMSPGAHGGAAFLPWHREYLIRFENALFDRGFTGPGLPYWDSTLDQTLPDASDAQIWTAAYLGNNNGAVTVGPFVPWAPITGCGSALTRNTLTGSTGQTYLYQDSDLSYIYGKNCFKEISAPTDWAFESAHGSVHVWLGGSGGQMSNINCGPTDPVFFMHHAFVDCAWETFRQNHQTSNRETEYPTSGYGSASHKWDTDMEPFDGLINAHGISNHYTNYYYQCKPRPKSCSSHGSCGNLATLWCDMSHCRCRPRVRQGGDCTGLPHRACAGPCPFFKFPRCVSNVCTCQSLIVKEAKHVVDKSPAFPGKK